MAKNNKKGQNEFISYIDLMSFHAEGKRLVGAMEEIDDDADHYDRSGGIRASLKVGSLRTNRRMVGLAIT